MDFIEQTVVDLLQTTDRMLALVEKTPDDRLFWKPSPSGRSIGEVAAHAAHALGNITTQLQGNPFPIPTSSQANQTFREHDQEFTDREKVMRYVRENRDGYVSCLRSFSVDDLDRPLTMPFGLGETTLRFFMTAGNMHTIGHIAQIEYIQTLYGDHDWHTGF